MIFSPAVIWLELSITKRFCKVSSFLISLKLSSIFILLIIPASSWSFSQSFTNQCVHRYVNMCACQKKEEIKGKALLKVKYLH